MENVVVLSEVHPIYDLVEGISPTMSISRQAKEWYGIDLRTNTYADQICEMHGWCQANHKHLVVRDWTYIDFTPNRFNGFAPCNESTGYESIRNRVNVKRIAFVRDAIDVALSQGMEIGEFSNCYINYVRYLVQNKIQVIKYEEFCKEPSATLGKICSILQLPKPIGEAVSCNNSNVSGDIGYSRGNRKDSVVELKRQYVFRSKRDEIDSDMYLRRCNMLLGYPESYAGRNLETLSEYLGFSLLSPFGSIKKRLIKKLL